MQQVDSGQAAAWIDSLNRDWDEQGYSELDRGALPDYVLAARTINEGVEVMTEEFYDFYRLSESQYEEMKGQLSPPDHK